jgi:serine protease Do
MNSAIRGGGAQGIGFAIPINMMKQLLPMLLRDGHVTRSALGINIVDARKLSVEERSALKLGTGSRVMGAVIEYVAPSGPGARAGLRPGDTIVAFDGQSIGRSEELQWLASTAGVGRQVALTVLRQGSSVEIKATLGRLADQMPGPR